MAELLDHEIDLINKYREKIVIKDDTTRANVPLFPPKNTTIIKVDEWVVIKLPSSSAKLVELKADKVISLGKFGMFKVDQVLGYKFGQMFEVEDNDTVKPVDGKDLLTEPAPEEEEDEEEVKYSEDNSNLVDLGSSVQGLGVDEIEAMKKQSFSSKTGKLIIESIVSKHENFNKKTKYSQVKYMKRKREKYARNFVIDYISPHELLKYYVENKELRKNLDLSEETMSYILNLANVRPGGKYLITDESLGLLTYFMLERMNGQGQIYVVTENQHGNLIALERYLNYPMGYIGHMVKQINWLQLISPVQDTLLNDESIRYFEPIVSRQEIDLLTKNKRSQYYRKLGNYTGLLDKLEAVKIGNFDGLIVMSTLHVPDIVDILIDRIGGSRPVVVYSPFKELLVELFHHLKYTSVLAPSILEIRARYYQPIPGKLHPVMTMRGGGGYVLWGTRVFLLENAQAVGKGQKKKKVVSEETVEPSTGSLPDEA